MAKFLALAISVAIAKIAEDRDRHVACNGEEVVWTSCMHKSICHPCKRQDCKLSAWSDWSKGDCSGLCSRNRRVKQSNNECGTPCQAALIETTNADRCFTCTPHKQINCKWHSWTHWSDCSSTCRDELGKQERNRSIETIPAAGGELCPAKVSREVRHCNGSKACPGSKCIDGTWSDWGDWGQCSHACGGGLRHRTRDQGLANNWCGQPAAGPTVNFTECNVEKMCMEKRDCKFDDWDDWSACSEKCGGYAHRGRVVKVHAKGNGKMCKGATKEIHNCNPGLKGKNESNPDGCAPAFKECEWKPWSSWSKCPVKCGGGQQYRQRETVKQEEPLVQCKGRHPILKVRACGQKSCHKLHVRNCTWGEWSEWGICDKCAGQKRRHRHITQQPRDGGSPCPFHEPREMTTQCPRECNKKLTCKWGDWRDWGECSVSCGIGSMMRKRKMQTHYADEVSEDEVDELQSRLADVRSDTNGELAAAFGLGCFSFVVLIGGVRVVRTLRRADYNQLYPATPRTMHRGSSNPQHEDGQDQLLVESITEE